MTGSQYSPAPRDLGGLDELGELALRDLGELASAIRGRRISSRELLGGYLRRVKAIHVAHDWVPFRRCRGCDPPQA